jgi:hypothetical protein
MDRLIKSLISILIGVFVLYLVSAILAVAVLLVIGGVKWYINYRNSKIEWTEWQFSSVSTPLVSIENGAKLFQSQEYWVRYNNFTQEWDAKLIIDPIKRPFNQATKLEDQWSLMHR